jgi:hypothetical protein
LLVLAVWPPPRFPDESTPIEATPLSATSAELGLGLGVGFGLGSLTHSSSHALPFFSPPSFRTLSLSPAFTMCVGQTSPHEPRLVVSHNTCPPLSSSPHAHIFVLHWWRGLSTVERMLDRWSSGWGESNLKTNKLSVTQNFAPFRQSSLGDCTRPLLPTQGLKLQPHQRWSRTQRDSWTPNTPPCQMPTQ